MTSHHKEYSHILIGRLSAMGDVAMTVPVVEALRKSYPELRISILTRNFFRPFFRNIDSLEFIDFDPDGKHKGFRGLLRLGATIKSSGVEAFADMHDVMRTQVLRSILRSRGVAVAVIDKGREEKRELTRRTRKVFAPLEPMTTRYRDVLQKLGFVIDSLPDYSSNPQPLPSSISALTGEKKGVWVGVAPFSKHKGKIYPIPLSDKLIEMLSERYEKVLIFGGGAHEKSFAEGMEVRHSGVVSVIGRVDLGQEMDVISNLDAIITMDSAQMHIASILGIPVVSVWGATHPYAGFYGYGQDPANAVQLPLDCRPCSVYGNKPCIFSDHRCLADIPPSMIYERVSHVIDNASR